MGTEILCDGQFHVSREGRTLILQAHIASHETCTAAPSDVLLEYDFSSA